MTTSFRDDQLKPPAQPQEKPIVISSNVRHRDPPPVLADTPGIVNRIDGFTPGKCRIGVSWKVQGQSLPEQWHDERELENTD